MENSRLHSFLAAFRLNLFPRANGNAGSLRGTFPILTERFAAISSGLKDFHIEGWLATSFGLDADDAKYLSTKVRLNRRIAVFFFVFVFLSQINNLLLFLIQLGDNRSGTLSFPEFVTAHIDGILPLCVDLFFFSFQKLS
jgi:hypothetical protein